MTSHKSKVVMGKLRGKEKEEGLIHAHVLLERGEGNIFHRLGENPIGISLKKEEFLSMEKSVLCRSLFLRRVRGEYRQKKEENEQKNEASRI